MRRIAIAALCAVLMASSVLPALSLMGTRRVLMGGVLHPILSLSNATVASTATVGTVIGALSVANGKGSYTYSLTSNPGTLFSIVGSSLEVAAALSVGSDPIIVQANNGAGSIVTQPFTIVVTGAGCSGAINLSNGCVQAMLGGL